MALFDFASNLEETKELHSNQYLRTHYYKSRYNNIKEIVIAYAKSKKINIKSEDDRHGEIFLQANGYHIIVSIVQVTPLETAVDVKVQTYRILGLYKPMKLIFTLYNHINTKAEFKGSGLHP
jgi:uncharacterized protein YktA (UPF0223 family)